MEPDESPASLVLAGGLFTPVPPVVGEGSGTPLQYSCLENPMDGGAWWAAVHGVAKSWTWLTDVTFTFHFHALEKEMATHSSVLAWRIPGTGSLVGCRLWGRTESLGHDWSDLAAAAAAPVVAVTIMGWGTTPSTNSSIPPAQLTTLRRPSLTLCLFPWWIPTTLRGVHSWSCYLLCWKSSGTETMPTEGG